MAGGGTGKVNAQRSRFRPHGAPAGSWPHDHWTVCVFQDPYERINFWSHFLPGAAFVALAYAAAAGAAPGGQPLAVFCACAAVTHLFSALTHVWPDSHKLEKLDHVGIVALILGTPATQLMAVHPHGDTSCMALCSAALLVAAALPPVPRTLGFVGASVVMVCHYWYIFNASLLVQVLLYGAGAVSFLRNGGLERLPWGLTDHHLLHYKVTAACCLQLHNLIRLQQAAGGGGSGGFSS